MRQGKAASDVKRLMLQSYRRYTNGETSEAKAYKENALSLNPNNESYEDE